MVNPFKSKKGAAIEMSIIFLLTVFFLCVIIVMLSLSISHQGTDFVKEQKAKFVVDEIGGLFVDSVKNNQSKEQIEQAIMDLLEDKQEQDNFTFYVNVTGQDAMLRVTKKRVAEGDDASQSQAVYIGTALEIAIDDGNVVKWSYN